MWSVTITDVKKEQGVALITALFTDSVSGETILRVYPINGFVNLNLVMLNRIKNDLDSFNAAYTFAGTVPLGVPDFSPLVPPPPTPAEIALQKFVTDFIVLRGMVRLIDLDIKKKTDQDYKDQVILVKAELLPAYYALAATTP
jgi:hypothetical protein